MATDTQTRQQRLLQVSAEEIEEVYRQGDITAEQRNKLLRMKARSVVDVTLEEKGFLGAVFAQSIKHIQDGWDNLKEAAIRDPSGKVWTETYYVGLAVWGEIQILTSVLNAVGEVTGQVAENMALKAGASPGLARMVNIATDIGTGFVPIGLLAKSTAATVRHVGKVGKVTAAEKALKAQMKAAEAAELAAGKMAEAMMLESPEAALKLLTHAKMQRLTSTAEKLTPEALQQIEKKAATMAEAQLAPLAVQRAEQAAAAAAATRSVTRAASDIVESGQKGPIYRAGEPGRYFSRDREFVRTDFPGKEIRAAELTGKERLLDLREAGTIKLHELATPAERKILDDPSKLTGPEGQAIYDDILKRNGYDGFRMSEQGINDRLVETIYLRKGKSPDFPIEPIKTQIGEVATPSVQEQFAADLQKFQKEIRTLTETQTHAETAQMAEKLGYTLDDLKDLIPGAALDEKQMYAYLKALEPQVETLITLAKTALAEGTEAASNALAKHASEFFTVAPRFRGAEVTAGRSVEILKETPPMKQLTEMLMGWDPEKVAKGDFTGAIQTFAEDIVALADQPQKVKALAVQAQTGWARFKENWWPMAREAYINLLLARPITQVRNFAGNSIAASNAVLERLAGGIFSLDRAKGLAAGEAFYLGKGMAMALADGLKAFGQAFKKVGPDEINRFDFIPGEIPGLLGRIIRSPGDMTRGMDNLFKTILRRGSHYAQAMREGTQNGLKGDDLANFISRRVNHPTERMLKEAEQFALTQTFQNDLGTLGKAARNLAQAGPLVLWFPFMKTPINLAKYAWNRTPGLQLLSKSLYDDILEGGVKADLAIGRLTMSNLMGMFIYELAKEGMITGSGPVDPGLRRVWLATNKPYSVKTKDGWIPIANAEPGSTVVGMIGDFAQIHNQLDTPSAEQAAMSIAFTVMHNLADKTYWQTVSDLVDVASGVSLGHAPGKKFRDVLLAPAVTVATGGPLGAGVARAIDPVVRETRTLMDSFLAKVPGYSQDLPPKRDAYGDPILPPQAIGGPWVGLASPLQLAPLTEDRVKLEGERLQIKSPAFPWSIGGVTRDDFDLRAPFPEDRLGIELTPPQRDRWQEIYRNLLRHPKHGIEAQLLDNPRFQQSTRAAQREDYMDVMADYRATAREALLVEDVELGKKLLESEASRLLPLLQADERRRMEPQIRRSITLFERLAPQQRANLLRWGYLESETDE